MSLELRTRIRITYCIIVITTFLELVIPFTQIYLHSDDNERDINNGSDIIINVTSIADTSDYDNTDYSETIWVFILVFMANMSAIVGLRLRKHWILIPWLIVYMIGIIL